MSDRELTFTTYETILGEVRLGKKSMQMETWIVSDKLFDCGLFSDEGPGHYSLARYISRKNLVATGLIANLKDKEANGVAIIRKSIAKWLTDEEILVLIHHEGAHMILGHSGANPEKEHEEIKRRNPENEIEVDLISQRLLVLHPEIRERAMGNK